MVMRVGMQDLDKALARIVDRARTEPVQVMRYARPWVWIVGHELWNRPLSTVEFVPEDHHLRPMRKHVDTLLVRHIAALFRLGEKLRLDIPIEAAMRALVLQLLHSIRDEQELAERIGYDLTFRWFVGLELDHPMPTPQALAAELLRLRRQEPAVRTLQRVMYDMIPAGLDAWHGKVVPDYGMLSLWMSPFLVQRGRKSRH